MSEATKLTEMEQDAQPRVADKEISFPGRMIYTTAAGDSIVGCKFEWFESDVALNQFFEKHIHDGLRVVGMYPQTSGSIGIVYTCQLNREDLEFIATKSEVMESLTKQRWAEKQATKEANLKAREAQEAELKRLANLGLKCEQTHRKEKKS